MSSEEKRTVGEVIYNMVHLWTGITDEKKIKREVHRWAKTKRKPIKKD